MHPLGRRRLGVVPSHHRAPIGHPNAPPGRPGADQGRCSTS